METTESTNMVRAKPALHKVILQEVEITERDLQWKKPNKRFADPDLVEVVERKSVEIRIKPMFSNTEWEKTPSRSVKILREMEVDF